MHRPARAGDSDSTSTSQGDAETAGDIAALIEELSCPAVVIGYRLKYDDQFQHTHLRRTRVGRKSECDPS